LDERLRLHLIPWRTDRTVRHHQQCRQPLARLWRHGRNNPAVVAAVHISPCGTGDLQEGAEGRQLVALSHEFLDRGIHDVGEVVARAR
jgi:hypothetical protein